MPLHLHVRHLLGAGHPVQPERLLIGTYTAGGSAYWTQDFGRI